MKDGILTPQPQNELLDQLNSQAGEVATRLTESVNEIIKDTGYNAGVILLGLVQATANAGVQMEPPNMPGSSAQVLPQALSGAILTAQMNKATVEQAEADAVDGTDEAIDAETAQRDDQENDMSKDQFHADDDGA